MKNLYSKIFFAIFFAFLGMPKSFAQDSNAITELRQKLKDAKDEKSRVDAKLALMNQFNKEGQKDSIVAYSWDLIEYGKKIKNNSLVANMYMTLSTMYILKGDPTTAGKYREDAEKYFQLLNDFDSKAKLLMTKASSRSMQNDMTGAIKLLDEALELNKKNPGKISPSLIRNIFQMNISNHLIQTKYSEAFKKANDYLDYSTKYDKEFRNVPYYYMGFLQYEMKNFNKAIEFLNQGENVSPVKSSETVANINVIRSFCYMELKDFEKAKYYASNALAYYDKQGNIENTSRIYYLFAQLYLKEKDYKKAQEFAQKAFESAPVNSAYQIKPFSKLLMPMIKVDQIKEGATTFSSETEKKEVLKSLRSEIEDRYKDVLAGELVHNTGFDATVWEYYSKIDEMLGDYESAFSYYKKYKEIENKSTSAENIRGIEEVQSERALSEQKLKIKLEEETKRIQLQKELELKALRYEFDKKQAAAKTEEERQRLLLEEEHKRREISIKYDEEQKAVAIKYEQEKKVAKAEQAKKDAEAKAELSKSKNIRNMSIGGALAALLLLGFAGWSYNQKRKDGIKIAAEKKKSEDLLLNILPQEVAQELKEKGKSEAKYYDEVSVLFTDFVNFTAASEKIGVQELLAELNVCFTEFDNIMGKHGLEKIKTIGDAYLAVSGLPTTNKDHAKNAIAASQDILKFIEERKKVSPHALDLRIGIHSGQVIAGIVGVKKFAYDIWGDTVNTAARMEQAGEKGKINISKNTYELIKDDFATTYRGKISVKGKGEMEMYFVERI
ncbi:adenylate/guanylate cyclase domain-containing protein [Soonwooa sp.]|uniref:adenylate/guanylate cyclase domain-containing protein n=1 Tax=Soonwooa sp. TaxID=1938592 RepID=UPI002605A6B2|nr:adenylate/guanylate cyclase domain-containing protein [Soonwooa sp.]